MSPVSVAQDTRCTRIVHPPGGRLYSRSTQAADCPWIRTPDRKLARSESHSGLWSVMVAADPGPAQRSPGLAPGPRTPGIIRCLRDSETQEETLAAARLATPGRSGRVCRQHHVSC
jgi:hypothetical protein